MSTKTFEALSKMDKEHLIQARVHVSMTDMPKEEKEVIYEYIDKQFDLVDNASVVVSEIKPDEWR